MDASSEVALLETVGVRKGRAPLWPLHLARLQKSAFALGLTLPDQIARPSGGGTHVVRYALAGGQLYVAGRPLEETSSVQLATSSMPHLGYAHKTDHRNWLDDARALAAQSGADDALLLDAWGFVVETSIWAVGWWEEDAFAFPSLGLGGLPSVARRRLAELTKVIEVRRTLPELAGRSLLACNAARGVVQVSALDGVEVPSDPRTDRLALRFWDRPDA